MLKDNSKSPVVPHLLPMIMLGILFFIFGLVSWVNSILIPYFKVACELTHTQSYFVALAFYIAYLVMSIPAAKLIGHIGSKKGIITGLWLMAVGTLLFVPAAYTRAYPIFLTGLFTIGTGLSILQTVANPYVTILGPIESAARRISIMGLCNKVAGILAPLLFAAIILRNSDTILFETLKSGNLSVIDKEPLLNELIQRVITPYTVLSVFLFLFGCLVHFIRLPELGNEKEEKGSIPSENGHRSIGSFPSLVLGVFAVFFHVAEKVISIAPIMSYAASMGFNLHEAKIFPSLTLTCALLGYFLGILLIPRFASQQQLFRLCTIGGLILSLCVLFIPGSIEIYGHDTSLSILCLSLMGVCNALIYAGIWPLAIHDLGKWTNLGSSFMVMALCGNAFMPVIYGLIADNYGLRIGYVVLIPCFLYLIFYAFYGYKLNHWSELWKLKKDK